MNRPVQTGSPTVTEVLDQRTSQTEEPERKENSEQEEAVLEENGDRSESADIDLTQVS